MARITVAPPLTISPPAKIMCQYTSHGHCGIIRNDEIVNDETLNYLSKIALSHGNYDTYDEEGIFECF